MLTAEFHQQLASLVEGSLDSNAEAKPRQMQLLSALVSDMSEPTAKLVAKLNCETKCETSRM